MRQEKAITLGEFVGVWKRPIQGFSCTICFVLGKPVGSEYHPPHFTGEEVEVGGDEQLVTLTQPVRSSEVCAVNQQN